MLHRREKKKTEQHRRDEGKYKLNNFQISEIKLFWQLKNRSKDSNDLLQYTN